MSISVSNTNLNDSFNTWRLNTNQIADAMSNNVVTVFRAGDANRGGSVTGNGHVSGTFSATQLRTDTLRGGNTTNDGALTIDGNTNITGTSLTVAANTTFTGNVIFNTVGTDRVNLGDDSRVIISGGSTGQMLTAANSTGAVAFSGDYYAVANVNTLLDNKMSVANSRALYNAVTANVISTVNVASYMSVSNTQALYNTLAANTASTANLDAVAAASLAYSIAFGG